MLRERLRACAAAWAGCLVVALVAGCHGEREKLPPESGTPAKSEGIKVTTQPVTYRPVQRIVGVVGTLHGYEELSLSAKVEGRVRKIGHDVADRVQPGEVLLEIDPTDYQLAVRQAQKALAVECAKLGLSEVPGSKLDVTRIPTVLQAQLKRDNAERRMERAKTLVSRKAGTEEDLTEKQLEFQWAQAEYDNQVLVAKAGIASIQVKQEALAIARQHLQDVQIRVPEPSQPVPGLDGGVTYAITKRPVSEGSYVMPGTEVFKIVIDRPLKFRGRVPERKVGEVRLKQQAQVLSAAYPNPFPGEVTRINPSIDPQTRTFEVEILVPNMQNELRPGGFAKAGILTELDEHAATVPLEAPVHFAGVTKIFLVENGVAKEVQVTLGVQNTEWVEIASPKLTEGALVVTSGQTAIANGTAVALRSQDGSAAGIVHKPVTAEDEPAEVARREAQP